MKQRTKKRILSSISLMLVVILLFTACGSSNGGSESSETKKEKLKVAFVYNGAVGDNGWCDVQEASRKQCQEDLNDIIETEYIEPVTPGTAAEQVFSELGDKKYDVVVAATAAYQGDVEKIAPSYPDTHFIISSGSVSGENYSSYWPDRTALWYLYGVMAGMMTKTNKIGFTASNPIPLVICCQNAFLLGAQSVNPDVTQTVIYIGTFYDPAAETDAANTLAEAGCDILWNNTDTPSHVQVAQEKGLYAMSQYADQREFGPDSYLGGEIINWTPFYEKAFQEIYDGTYEEDKYYPGLETGACELQPYTKNVPEDIQKKIDELKEEICAADDLYSVVFKGPIYDVDGKLRCKEGEHLKAEDLVVGGNMDWFVKGTITSVK